MASYEGSEQTLWVFPDGDYVSGAVMLIDTSGWTMADFIALDQCPKHERAGLAKVIEAIRLSSGLSVVEITIKK
jgi:hypothetical protein